MNLTYMAAEFRASIKKIDLFKACNKFLLSSMSFTVLEEPPNSEFVPEQAELVQESSGFEYSNQVNKPLKNGSNVYTNLYFLPSTINIL